MSSPFSLEGRTTLVTGATGGIGEAVVATLVEAGSKVACIDVNQEAVGRVAAKYSHGDATVIGIGADVTDVAQMTKAVQQTEAELGQLRHAVNCAGINGQAPAETMSAKDWRRLIDINLTGVFISCQAEGSALLANGGGSIVNIGSVSAAIANRGLNQVHYNSAKAGVVHLTSSLALEWADRNVRVNSVSPGYTKTAMVVAAWESIKSVVDDIPAQRMAEPRDIALAVQFLLSDASSYVVGEDLLVDGGHSKW